MPPDKALLAQLPDPRRCKDKNPAAALDAVVKKYPWFRFGFRAGDRRISFDYAADPTGKRPGGNLLVSRIVVILPDGRTMHTNGPAGDAPPFTISKLLRQIDGPAPDLTTLWVSRHKNAPKPLPFGDLAAAAVVKLLGAKATPPENDDAVTLAQRALGSDWELDATFALKGDRIVSLSSDGLGMVSLKTPNRRSDRYLCLADAMAALGKQYGSKLELSRTRFETFSRDNRRLGDGPWVDTPTLRRLVLAGAAEVAETA